jgi:hypothetical protein
MVAFISTSLQLQKIITAHNKWLRLAPFLTALWASSLLPPWLTWYYRSLASRWAPPYITVAGLHFTFTPLMTILAWYILPLQLVGDSPYVVGLRLLLLWLFSGFWRWQGQVKSAWQGFNTGLSSESQWNTHRLACTINTDGLILVTDITLNCLLSGKHFWSYT